MSDKVNLAKLKPIQQRPQIPGEILNRILVIRPLGLASPAHVVSDPSVPLRQQSQHRFPPGGSSPVPMHKHDRLALSVPTLDIVNLQLTGINTTHNSHQSLPTQTET